MGCFPSWQELPTLKGRIVLGIDDGDVHPFHAKQRYAPEIDNDQNRLL